MKTCTTVQLPAGGPWFLYWRPLFDPVRAPYFEKTEHLLFFSILSIYCLIRRKGSGWIQSQTCRDISILLEASNTGLQYLWARPALILKRVCVDPRYPADLKTFTRSGMKGAWERERSGQRLKLKEPETWERLLSMEGNKASTWEKLIGLLNTNTFSFFNYCSTFLFINWKNP